MKKILALALAMLMVLALCACGSSDGASWADYQAYLIEKGGANSPDADEFAAQVNALKSWDDIDQTTSPWDQIFSTVGLSTWEEYQAGTVKEPAAVGSMAEGGDASGEPSGEMGGDVPSDVPASASQTNSAHGTASADEAGYKEYLHAWLDAEFAVNTTMDDSTKTEFEACIEALDFTTFPGDMFFSGMLTTGAAMTYDEFIAAGGAY